MSASRLEPFDYAEPASVPEAVELLNDFGEGARILAGGVDLIPRMRAGSVKADLLIGLQRCEGLDYTQRTTDGGIGFGAMTSLHSLETWGDLQSDYSALRDAIHQITSVQSKYMGTAVGNLCVATPASDVGPALAAYDAELLISGPGGDRRVSVADFYPSYGHTQLGRGELVTGVFVPPPPPRHGAAFLNLVRTHADIAKVTVTAAVVLEDDACVGARIALGSVAPTMSRAREAEALLTGKGFSSEAIEEAASLAVEREAKPIDDIRSTAEYRRATAEVLVARALRKAGERARASAAKGVAQ